MKKNLAFSTVVMIILCFSWTSSTTFLDSEVKAQSNTCPTPQPQNTACVRVTKEILDPNGLVPDSVEAALQFNVQFTVNGVAGSTFTLNEGEVAFELLIVGQQYSVNEVPPFPDVTFTTTFSSDCNGTIVQSTTPNCVITNTITGGPGTGGVLLGQAQGAPAPTPSNIETGALGTATAQGGALAGGITGSGVTRGTINPPFDICKANFFTAGSGSTQIQRRIGTDEANLIRAPTSATYTMGGTISLDKVADALNMFGTRKLAIQLYSNLDIGNQHLPLAISDPQFKGLVVVEDSEGVKHEVIKFNLDTIRTECKFITLAKVVGNPSDNNIYSLADVGNDRSTKISKNDEILIQNGGMLSTSTDKKFPLELNPPFATCDVSTAAASGEPAFAINNDNIGIYSVSGEVKEVGSLFGEDLRVEINTDLVPIPADKALITDNNNPYAKVNLIADEDTDSAHKIPFELHDIWTDCKDLALHTQPLFEPIQSEIRP